MDSHLLFYIDRNTEVYSKRYFVVCTIDIFDAIVDNRKMELYANKDEVLSFLVHNVIYTHNY